MSLTRQRCALVGVCAVLVALVGGCGADPASARGAVERFLDARYVRIDLQGALAESRGVARSKIERELSLVEGQAIDQDTRRPIVRYRLDEERAEGTDAVQFVYEGSISVPDADTFHQRWLLTARREEARWWVTNFQEVAP